MKRSSSNVMKNAVTLDEESKFQYKKNDQRNNVLILESNNENAPSIEYSDIIENIEQEKDYNGQIRIEINKNKSILDHLP